MLNADTNHTARLHDTFYIGVDLRNYKRNWKGKMFKTKMKLKRKNKLKTKTETKTTKNCS